MQGFRQTRHSEHTRWLHPLHTAPLFINNPRDFWHRAQDLSWYSWLTFLAPFHRSCCSCIFNFLILSSSVFLTIWSRYRTSRTASRSNSLRKFRLNSQAIFAELHLFRWLLTHCSTIFKMMDTTLENIMWLSRSECLSRVCLLPWLVICFTVSYPRGKK